MHEAPSFITWMYKFGIMPHWLPDAIPFSWLVIAILLVIAYIGTRKLEALPSGVQNLVEAVVESLRAFFDKILGHERAAAYTPFLGTLFIYIVLLNAIGLIPGFKSPTSNLNMTLSLALVVFVSTHIYGCQARGVVGYVKHFAGPVWWLAPLMFPIEIVSNLARPISLSLRLYGNIMGEDTAIMILIGIAPLFIPVQFPLMALGILTSLIQGLLFSLLAAVYIAGATEIHEHH
jgi:F-type H+-transporting ATPase subunit a